MLTLFHHPMSAASRFVRLIFAEYSEDLQLIEEVPWALRSEFLALNPAGSLPLLLADNDLPLSNEFAICEYLDETRGPMMRDRRLMADTPADRAEIRRLCQWFLTKMEAEATNPMVRERIFKTLMPRDHGGGSPDTGTIRNARLNTRQHMKYIEWLCAHRNWIAGNYMTYADLAAAASLSLLDYLGEIDWTATPTAREWYARVKSRPAFRPLLADRVRSVPPSSHYPDLDF